MGDTTQCALEGDVSYYVHSRHQLYTPPLSLSRTPSHSCIQLYTGRAQERRAFFDVCSYIYCTAAAAAARTFTPRCSAGSMVRVRYSRKYS